MTATDPAAMRRVELTRRVNLLDARGAPISASQRWSGLLAEDAPVVRALVEQGLAFAREHAPEWLRKAATWLAFRGLVGKLDRWYVAEITAIAERLGFSVYDMAMIQQQNTWGHPESYRKEFVTGASVAWSRVPWIMGCCARWNEDARAEHYQTLVAGGGRVGL